MPDLATTDSPITLVKWLVPVGQAIKRGDFILEVETDKASMEVEATVNGNLIEAKYEAGDKVNVGEVIALIKTEEDTAQNIPNSLSPKTGGSAAPSSSPEKKTGGLFARNRAAAKNAFVSAIEKPKRHFAAPGTLEKLSPARRTAARRLQESKQSIPHFYLQTSALAEPMMERRKAALPEKLAWDAFFVKAVSNALKQFDGMAYRFEDDQLLPQGTNTIGVAADIDGALFVVGVDEPQTKEADEISREIRNSVAALREGDPTARRMKPGVMTISNLGGSNVETFTAIINPPESAILAIGKIRPVVVAKSDVAFAIEHRLNLTLSVDHRVVNGKYAADFLGEIVKQIENL